jgi:acetylornithine deacetylase
MRAVYPEASITTKLRAEVPPLVPTAHNPADILCRALTGDNGSHSVSYAAEAGIFQKAGFSVVICGPGDIAQAHQPNEFIAVEQIRACEDFMRKLADWAASR